MILQSAKNLTTKDEFSCTFEWFYYYIAVVSRKDYAWDSTGAEVEF